MILEFEKAIHQTGSDYIIGCDEVGRGSLAGPVVACAVMFDMKKLFEEVHEWYAHIKDSKKIIAHKREVLNEHILQYAFRVKIGEASVEEIDTINIHNATLLAMQRAIEQCTEDVKRENIFVAVDGKFLVPNLKEKQQAVIDGDASIFSISCASICAKVYRDALLVKLDTLFPEYLWAKNKAYGTKQHIQAIKTKGLTQHHRKTFCNHL